MAKFGIKEADYYGGGGNALYFSLKEDKDTAVLRFMYETAEDIEGMSVHEVEIDGKKRYVNCLRSHKDPAESCPLCAAGMKPIAKFFIPVYLEETGEVGIWDRGKTFMSKLGGLCARYNPLVSTPFEVERNGKKGDTKTTYETYPLQSDDTTLDSLPELPTILGGLVLDKTFDELNYYLDNGYFESNDAQAEQPPFRGGTDTTRRPTPQRQQQAAPTNQPQRRVPSNQGTTAPAGRRTPMSQQNRDKF